MKVEQLSSLDVVLAGVQVDDCTDPRRCIVVRAHADELELIPCSSQSDLYDPYHDLWISHDESEWRRFGFTRPSYAMDRPPILLPRKLVKRRYGRLDGEAAEKFQDWFGEKIV